MPRALWVTSSPPDRSGGGGHIRQAHLLEALARAVSTDLLTVGEVRDEGLRRALAAVTELSDPGPPPALPRQLRRMADLWRAGRPAMAEVVDNASHRRRLAPALRGHAAYDIVHVGEYGLAPLLPARRANRWAVTYNNIPSDVARQAAAVAPGRRQRWLWERERAKALRFERWAEDAFDLVMAVSDEDAGALPGSAIVVPNGVDTRLFRPTPLPAAPRLFFSGTLGYRPNADGLAWFCTEVFPRVRAAVQDATLEIVGRLPTPEVLALAHRPGVQIHVEVPSVVPHLTRARVAVVPLRIGSGTRLKALEAMAAGRPLVGTTIGLDGLGIVPGQHAVVADDPDGLAAGIVAVLRDEDLASRLAAQGRSLVEQRFGWDRIGAAFVDALLSAAPARRRPDPDGRP